MPPPAPQSSPFPDEDPAIAEALTEVEVLIKYGLAVKAIEMLEGMAENFPENLQIRIKLKDLYREQGNVRKAADHILVLADIYAKRQQDEVEPLLRAALEMDPGNVEIAARLGVAPAAGIEAAFALAGGERRTLDDTLVTEGQSAEEIVSPEVNPAEITFGDLDMVPFEPEVAPSAAAVPLDDIVFEEPQLAGPTLERDASEQASRPPEVPAGKPPLPVDESPISEPEPEQPELLAEAEPEQTGLGEHPSVEPMQQSFQGSLATETDISEIWAEAEFYYQQGLFDEAKKYYSKIIERAPSDRRAIERLSEISREEEETQEFSKLAEAVEGLESMISGGVSEGEMALTASDEEAVRSLMSEIQKLKQEQKPAPSPTAEHVAAPVTSETSQKQSGIRDEREDRQFDSWEQEEPGEQAGGDDFHDLGRERQQERRADPP
jgi:tetratricopeptide (TPR) repeat protein